MEKTRPHQHVLSLNTDRSDSPTTSITHAKPEVSHWQPGYLKRFPYVGVIALLTTLLTAVCCVIVLYLSNGKSSAEWPRNFPPNVALSVFTSIGNLALATAFSRGTSIAWWRMAMNGATLAQLHESWSTTNSALGILSALSHLDKLGMAMIMVKLAVLDNVFYQRATSTYVGQDIARPVSISGVAATEFPTTGYVVSEGFSAQTACNCFMIGDTYTPVLNTWETSNGFFQGYNKLFQQCNGVCYTHINAIGFEIDCTTSQNHTDIAAAPIAAWNATSSHSGSASASWSDIPIFNSSFYMSYANKTTNYTSIILQLHYFQSDNPYNPSGESCAGSVFDVQCKLRPAIVRYPVTITNFTNPHVTNGVSLGSGSNSSSTNLYLQASNQNIQPYSPALKQAEGFEVVSYLYPNEQGLIDTTTSLGGIANALHIALSSNALITYQGQGSWALSQQGTLSQTMMYGPPNMGSCDCSFRSEALDTIITSINQLTFLTATGLLDDSTISFSNNSDDSPTKFSFPISRFGAGSSFNTSAPVTVQGIDSNSTAYFHSLPGTVQIKDVTFYRTHYLYLGLGVGTTLICMCMVIALYWRYGQLGRDVTLGPIEIAGAFGAPVLSTTPTDAAHHSPGTGKSHQPQPQPNSTPLSPASPTSPPAVSFANVKDLLATVGDRKVMYGFVDVEEEVEEEASHQSQQHYTAASTGVTPQSPLLLSPTSTHATRVRKSQILTFAPAEPARVKPAAGVPMSPESRKHTFE